jgi:hypothetical protein
MNIGDILRGNRHLMNVLEEDVVFTISVGHVFITYKQKFLDNSGRVIDTVSVKTPAYVLMDNLDVEEDIREGVGIEITPKTLTDPVEIFINGVHVLRIKVTRDPIEGLHLKLLGLVPKSVDNRDDRFRYVDKEDKIVVTNNTTYNEDLILLNEGEYYDDLLKKEISYFEDLMNAFEPGSKAKPDLTNIFATIDSMIRRGIVVIDEERKLYNSTNGMRDRLELYLQMLFNGTVFFGRVQHCKNAINFLLSVYLKPWIKRNLFRRRYDNFYIPSIKDFNEGLATGVNNERYDMWTYFMGGSNKTRKHRSGLMQKTKKIKYPSI